MKEFFGYIFLALGIILTGYQCVKYTQPIYYDFGRIFLLLLLTGFCSISGAVLIYSLSAIEKIQIAVALSLLTSIGIIGLIFYSIVSNEFHISGGAYILLIIYLLMWGTIGLSKLSEIKE